MFEKKKEKRQDVNISRVLFSQSIRMYLPFPSSYHVCPEIIPSSLIERYERTSSQVVIGNNSSNSKTQSAIAIATGNFMLKALAVAGSAVADMRHCVKPHRNSKKKRC